MAVSYNFDFEGLRKFVAFDGAKSPNIVEFLTERRLRACPLFKASAGEDIVLAGPWLMSVSADPETTRRQILDIGELGGGVCWLADCDESVLYAHLRQLNAAQMPDGRVVFFRHYDPDVLAAVIPLLNEHQAAKLFGPASVLGLIGGSSDGRHAIKPNGLPTPISGPIALRSEQIEILDERQRELWRKSCIASVRTAVPSKTTHLADADVYELILRYERNGKRVGLSSESALLKWVCLEVVTDGKASSDREAIKRRLGKLGAAKANYIFESEFNNIVDDLVRSKH